MSALDQILAQYREKNQISKSRKRPREASVQNYIPERTIKGKTEEASFENDHIIVDVSSDNK